MSKPPSYTQREQKFLDEMAMYGQNLVQGEIAKPSVNITMPGMFKDFLALTDEYWIGWWNEDDPNSPIEAHFRAVEGLTFEDGLLIAEVWRIIFPGAFQIENLGDNGESGRTWFRFIFDNEDEISIDDRVIGSEDERLGTALDFRQKDEDNPRSIQVKVMWDGDDAAEWTPRDELQKLP